MADKTAKDVVTRALRNANVIGANEEPEAADYDDALAEYMSWHEWLVTEFDGEAFWDFDSVPEEYWVDVAKWFCGAAMIDVIPVSAGNRDKAGSGASTGERMLREKLARRDIHVVQAEYF